MKYILFQYNSCYCLSPFLPLLLLFIANFNTTLVIVYRSGTCVTILNACNFNTTLVIVYQVQETALLFLSLFQYNSCYCLSSSTPLHTIP